MVSTRKYSEFLRKQEAKAKIKSEKEEKERKIREKVLEFAKKRKLERELAQKLEERLEYIEWKEKETLQRKEERRKERALKKEKRQKLREERIKKVREHPGITKTTEFVFTEEEKEKCRQKSLDQLVDELGGSALTCPPGKELKKEISPRELTADLVCFRKRIRKKGIKGIKAAYDKILDADPERLCK